MVKFHSKYISNQKNCCNPLNQVRHGSVKKVYFLFLLDYSFSKPNNKQLWECIVLKFGLSWPDLYIHIYIYIYIYI